MANRKGTGVVAHSSHSSSPPPASPAAPSTPPPPPTRLLAARSPGRIDNRALLRRFGQFLRAERTRRSLSQSDLAARSSVHRTHISLAECGRRDLRLSTVFALAAALRVPPGALMPPI